MATDPYVLSGRFIQWWRTNREDASLFEATRRFFSALTQSALDSLPSRRRQRYGDIDFDWDHRVDTTGATVPWRERLLGMLYSSYQPTEPALFREMIESLHADLSGLTFIDLGSGKGRTLLMASDYPFTRIIGVELLPSLHQIAAQNIAKYRSEHQQCFQLESICADASEYVFPCDPTVLYLFNPLPKPGLIKVVENLAQSLREKPRALFVIYHNPEHEEALSNSSLLERRLKTESYSIFASKH